jgi:cell division protein FtsQ
MSERHRRRRGRLIVVAGVGLALAAGAAASTYSGLFAADRLLVIGERMRTEDAILRRAGLAPGSNVFHLDRAGAREALLADPWIADAVIETSLPSTITVRVTERRPIAVSSGTVLAADGTVLPGAPPTGLPVIRGAGSLQPADRSGAASVVASLRPAERRALTAVTVASDGAVRLSLGPIEVRWGTPAENERKAAALAAVLDAEGTSSPSRIDVSVPGAPSSTA